MLYLITKAMAEELALPVLGKTHKDNLDFINNDKIRFICDFDYLEIIKVIDYFGLNFQIVIGHPTLPDPDGALIADKKFIIDWKSFEKTIKPTKDRRGRDSRYDLSKVMDIEGDGELTEGEEESRYSDKL